MTKKSLVLLVGLIFFMVVGFTSTALAMENGDNPIDKAFVKDMSEAKSTIEMNYVAGMNMQTWKAEMDNVATIMKAQYKFDEDKARIDAYTAAYEKVADATGYVEWLKWSNKDENPNNRSFATGVTSARLLAKADIYKQATLNLINTYEGRIGEDPDKKKKYTYVYSGNGAELGKMRVKYQ
jgi:hypothetical protein